MVSFRVLLRLLPWLHDNAVNIYFYKFQEPHIVSIRGRKGTSCHDEIFNKFGIIHAPKML